MVVQVALVSQSDSIPSSDVSLVSAAVQKQVTRDFGPIWSVDATVDSFDTLEDVPLGYWPMVVGNDVRETQQAEGVRWDTNGKPFARCQATDSWALTASPNGLESLPDACAERMLNAHAS